MNEFDYEDEFCREVEESARRYREERAKYTSKPTRTDIRETKKLLAQFGRRGVEIPELPTYCALERWRRKYIVCHLDEEVRDD